MSDELDFNEIQRAAQETRDEKEIRRLLPIGYVLHKYGIELTESDGKYVAICPFHADTRASLDVFGENLEHWGCYPCYGGMGLDVLDLIQALDPSVDRYARANELIQNLSSEGWNGPTRGKPRKQLDVLKASEFVNKAYDRANSSLLDSLCQLKSFPFDGKWLHSEFGVGTYSDWIVIPFYGAEAELVTFKRRTLTTRPRAAAGSDFTQTFYNHWGLTNDLDRPIVLCEGESDTWATHFAVGDSHTVLGIPTGAGGTKGGAAPTQAALLAGRTVILAFDGDPAGFAARQIWFDALAEVSCDVYFAPVPEGKDMATVADPRAVIEAATKVQLQAPIGLLETPNGYVHPATREDKPDSPVSNWYFHPSRELVGDGGLAYEGHIEPGHVESVISSFTLSKKSDVVQWATKHGRYWAGSDRDAQLLLGMLQAQSPFLMHGRLATVAGYYDNHYVWPGHKIGSDYVRYVAPTADVFLDSQMWIDPGPWKPEQVLTLRRLHAQEVMDPILAWLAACPIRALLREFPSLGVVGSSGTGKTTLMETVIPAFTATDITLNLTDTTPHVITALLGSTNCFPIRFDERRYGARKGALLSIDQMVRDSYTGQKSAKGGANRDHWAAVTFFQPLAPLVVSGEDSFTETSHTDRMVMIGLPPAGKNPQALLEVRAWGSTGFAWAYLSWLQSRLAAGQLDVYNPYSGDPDRQRTNMGVLGIGWRLLREFLLENGLDIGEPDFSLPRREAEEAKKHAPIEDALRWCLDEPDAGEFITSNSADGVPLLCVRVENFVHFVNKNGSFVLPGGATAVRRHLADKYGATEEVVSWYGIERRALVMDMRKLNWT